MTKLSDNAIKRLTSLINIISPSMQEGDMIDRLKSDWQSVTDTGESKIDAIGNLEFSIRRDNSYPTIALVAHADTICVQITQQTSNGKYRFRSIGCSPQMLLGQTVTVVNEAGEKFNGVIGFDATSKYGQPKGLVYEDLWIDVTNPENYKSIETGDLAVLKPEVSISGDYVTGTALDDRLGLFVIGEVLRWYSTGTLPVNITCVATVQEEVGLRGSSAFEFSHRPDAIFVLDVDYATDIPTSHEDQMGRLYLGQGPGVLKKADNSATLRKYIKNVASIHEIPLQISLGRFLYGGTDCSSLQATRDIKGCHVANITLPVRYMHSKVETASLTDVANTVRFIENIIERMPTASEIRQ